MHTHPLFREKLAIRILENAVVIIVIRIFIKAGEELADVPSGSLSLGLIMRIEAI